MSDSDRAASGFAHRHVFLGALASAEKSIRIVSPYFLPDAGLITALATAALRGVKVEILLPSVIDLRVVRWATMAQLWQVLEFGCKVYLTQPPFTHTKLMIVDGVWTMLGSANWDPRSLRLNFEFNVEIYNSEFAARVETAIEAKRRAAHELTLTEIDSRRLPVRLRDGLARLMSPYL